MDRSADGFVFRDLRIVMQLAICACFLAHVPGSFAEDSAPKAVRCGFTDPSLADTSDIQEVIDYKAL